MSVRTITFIILALAYSLQSSAQAVQEFEFIQTHVLDKEEKKSYAFNFRAKNEVQFLSHFAFTFYKKYVSSQDAISCTFQPSCSIYGLHAFEHHGLWIGSMATFDRLARCHSWNRGLYPIDPKNGLNIDPVAP
jgi:putative membrane protein insertion efficiency factor